MACSRCHGSRYCSRRCQLACWGSHKYFCPLDYTPPSTIGTVVALLFPTDGDRPVTLHVPVEIQHDYFDGYQAVFEVPMLRGLFGNKITADKYVRSRVSALRDDDDINDRSTPWFCFTMLDSFAGEPENRSVNVITGQRCPYRWCGPIVVFVGTLTETNDFEHSHLTVTHTEEIVHFFNSYGRPL